MRKGEWEVIKVQWKILLFLALANLSVGLVVALSLAGTEYANPLVPEGVDPEEYEEHFNSTAIAEGWGSSPFSGIPIVGDIFAGFNFLWQNIQFLADGLPMLLTWIKDSYITNAEGQLAFDVFANVLRASYAIIGSMFLIEFISGRDVTD
jgi:hypothetical protein